MNVMNSRSEIESLQVVFRERYKLPDHEGDKLIRVARAVLDHFEPERPRTGLVLGHVQAGKTLSITTLVALAADQGFRVIIALLGVTNILVQQNEKRLRAELRIDQGGNYRWLHLRRDGNLNGPAISRALKRDQVVLITTIKNPRALDRIAEELSKTTAVAAHRALIVDDEADQASLNTLAGKPDDEVSATYRSIAGLRRCLGSHLYVQYTATPFAPLLLQPDDQLSPEFVELLDPGPGYTGGRSFFIDNSELLVRAIPEITTKDGQGDLVRPLEEALAAFIAGCALARANGSPDHPLGRGEPVSMLVHPSHRTVAHEGYAREVERRVEEEWPTRLSLRPDDPAGRYVRALLMEARKDLVDGGVGDVEDRDFFDAVSWVLRFAEVTVVNSEAADEVDWSATPIHILVGGNKIERGFTVRGLTVSFMPRGPGARLADAIQQRARAFGYKAAYLPYCRFFAPQEVIDAYTSLAYTEEAMRESLEAWLGAGLPVSQWAEKEGILLDADLNPTRPTVVPRVDRRGMVGWHTMRRPVLEPQAQAAHRRLIEEVGLFHAPFVSYGLIRHRQLDRVPPDTVIRLLEQWETADTSHWPREALVTYLKDRSAKGMLEPATLVLLQDREGEGPRVRSWGPKGIPNLMQGSDEQTGYPGDRGIADRSQLMLQVHRIRLRAHRDVPEPPPEVYCLAIHIPPHPRYPSSQVLRP